MSAKVFADADRAIKPIPPEVRRTYHVDGGGLSDTHFADTADLDESECSAAPYISGFTTSDPLVEWEHEQGQARRQVIGAVVIACVVTGIAYGLHFYFTQGM